MEMKIKLKLVKKIKILPIKKKIKLLDKMTMTHKQTAFITNLETSDKETHLPPCYLMPPDVIIRKTKVTGKIAHADDLAITAREEKILKESFKKYWTQQVRYIQIPRNN